MENIIIECPFCAEEIEEGLEICPQCEEPLGEQAKRTMYTNQGRRKRKKSTKEKVWFGISIIVVLVGIGLSKYYDEIFDYLWNKSSGTEETVKVTSTKSDDFSSFIQMFISDEKYQLDHINFPLNSIESKKEWNFLGSDIIFVGVKKINGTDFQGKFVINESNNECTYTLGYPESDAIYVITFTKNNGKWLLTEFVDLF